MDSDDDIELIEQRELTSVPPDFLVRFFGHLAAELDPLGLDVPGDPQARRFPLESLDATLKCLVVRVDVRGTDATVELTIEGFADAGSSGPFVADRPSLIATLWRAAQQAAHPDPLVS